MNRTYELRCLDRALLTFRFTDDAFGTASAHILDIEDSNRNLLPLGMSLTDEGLYKWLSVRSLPHNRRYARELCASLGFSIDDVEAIYDVSLGLSLNDSYWMPEAGSAARFADVNLYENGFSQVIAAVAYTGQERLGPGGTPHCFTPELTTDGTLRKAWRIREGRRLLYKGASNDWCPGEPASELFASYIAQEASLFAVPYGIDSWQRETCSTCPCFCSPELSYTPFAVAAGVTDMGLMMGVGTLLGVPSFEMLCDMIVFDALICNEDRHFTNFGVLRAAGSGQFLGMAPIFDNGRGLLPMLRNDQLGDCGPQLAVMAPAFGGRSFIENAGRVLGPRQVSWLEKVENIDLAGALPSVSPAADLGVFEGRAAALTSFVRDRSRELLDLPVVDHDAMCEVLAKSAKARLEVSGRDDLDPLRVFDPSVLEGESTSRPEAFDFSSHYREKPTVR